MSVGVIFGRDLPFTSANSAVRIFRQAFALDEVLHLLHTTVDVLLTSTFPASSSVPTKLLSS